MGLRTYQNANIEDQALIAFDTKYAYTYTTGWDRLAGEVNPGASVWQGSNSQFFWTTTYSGASASDYVLYVTNFNQNEANFMRTFFANEWSNFSPLVSPTTTLVSCLMIVAFKNRLLALNTWEVTSGGMPIQYAGRMRYCALGSPLATNAWRSDIPGNGGGRDCPTEQAIVGSEFVKDRLIVHMESSTWEIVYTGNNASPFVWQQINSEFGVESTFSMVPFDKVSVGVGNLGIIACTGANVDRIDETIPDEVFTIHIPDQGVERVYGIRDYYTELIYWTFPSPDASATFPYPNRVLVYNYKNGSWAFNDDSFTVFGYYEPLVTQNQITWSSLNITWDDDSTWDSGSIATQFNNVVAGNQEGWTFIIDRNEPVNAGSLQITNMFVTTAGTNNITIVSIDHNMRVGPTQYLYFTGITGSGNITLLNGTIFPVLTVIDQNTFTIAYIDAIGSIIAGTYTGGGIMARVSNVQLLTKQYNFYRDKGRNFYISKVDFLVDSTANGVIQVNYYVSTANNDMIADAQLTNTLLGTGNLETFPYPTVPFESTATQLWHPVYIQADGEFIQISMNLTDQQMRNVLIMNSYFQMHAMLFFASPSSYRFH